MGCGISSVIVINLHRNNNLFYFSGECISGTVKLNIIEEKLEANEIYIKLTGEIGYTTTTVSTAKGGPTRQTEYHHVPFYSAKVIFAQPQPGQNQLVYDQGQYSGPFQILLPEYLPPTLNQPQLYPHVRYYLKVVIDKPWYKRNKRETKYLTIYPRVNILQNSLCLVSTKFRTQNRKDITLRGSLNKFGYVPGELIRVTLEIQNPRRVLIRHIDLSMFQLIQIGPDTRGSSLFNATLPKIVNLKDEQIYETFSIPIPDVPSPPSYQSQEGVHKVVIVQNRYFLRFTVRVEGTFTTFHVDVPIIFGTEPTPDLSQQQTFNSLLVAYSTNPEQLMLTDDGDSPPSYESVVQNMK